MARPSYEKMRRALMRSNTRLLMTSAVCLECLAMALVALNGGIDWFELGIAVILPVLTVAIPHLMGRIWPVDRAIVILVMLLTSIGIITLYDISRVHTTPNAQMIYMALGIVVMFFGAWLVRVFRRWKKWMKWLMLLGALALLSPWVLGQWHYGARNWIQLGSVASLQPSEFVKPLLVVILAAGLSGRPRFKKCIFPLGYAAVCCAILLSERDLGALLLYFLTTVLMYYAATSNGLVALGGLGAGAACAVAAYQMFDYVKDRVEIWINPWSDPLGEGYQIVQSLIAIGSGGLFGMGLGLGRPRTIPLYYSDFIFAAIAEEFGLIFSIGLLALYVILIMRGLIVAMHARSSFHSLIAFGIVTMMGLQTMLIVGGTTKLLPLSGVTLPFISAGGSSLISMFLSMGILLGISSMNAEDEAHDIEVRRMSEVDFR